MADNVTIPASGTGTATPVIATDDVGGVHYQVVKLDGGGDGLSARIGGDAANGLDVDVTRLPSGTVAGSASLPAGTNNIGDVDVLTMPSPTDVRPRIETTTDVSVAGTAKPIKYARINATASGDTVVVAAVASNKIRVLGYAFTASAACVVTFQDTAGTPNVLAGGFDVAANGGVSYAGGLHCPAFETISGNGLEVNLSATANVRGHLCYVEVG